MAIERRPIEPRRLVPHAHGLERHGRDPAPRRRPIDLRREPTRVRQVAPEPRTDRLHALLAQRQPDLEGTETPAERDAPVAIVTHLRVHWRLQVTRSGGHDAHQVFRVTDQVQRAVERHRHPLVRIDDDRIGAFDTLPIVTAFRQQHRRAAHGAIDVQPDPFSPRNRCERRDRIHRGGGGRAGGRDDGAGPEPRRTVAGNSRLERIDLHPELRIDWDRAHVLPAEAGQQRRLFNRAVRLRGHIDDQRSLCSLEPRTLCGIVTGTLACADQCDQRGDRSRVLDDAAEARRQAQQLAQPVGHDLLELCQRRARLPVETDYPEARAHHVAEHRGKRAAGREITEETWVLPVSDAGHDQPVEIAEDRLERFAQFRRGRWELCDELAGLGSGLHRQLALGKPFAVGRDPFHQRVPGVSKLVRCHGGGSSALAATLPWSHFRP